MCKYKLIDILKILSVYGIDVSIQFDASVSKSYIDLNTESKSHLYLYEDFILKGRYDYNKKMEFTGLNECEVIKLLCEEFKDSMYGRNFGNSDWISLCEKFDVELETYISM